MKFAEWLNQQDIELCQWESVGEGADHHHVLVPFTPEETDIIIERYLRNVRKIYGDQPAKAQWRDGTASVPHSWTDHHVCTFNCPEYHPEVDATEAKRRLAEIRKNKPL